MNIFVVDENPVVAARMLCDQHVVKMIVESVQMLFTALHVAGVKEPWMYKPTHARHPCTLWVASSRHNWRWLHMHASALCHEYTYRYDREHACTQMLRDVACFDEALPDVPCGAFVKAMPDEHKSGSTVDAYRRYYVVDKARFARWTRRRPPPAWWPYSTSKPPHGNLESWLART